MADLHPEVLKEIEAGPKRVMDLSLDSLDPSRLETHKEFARRIAALAVEKEAERCISVIPTNWCDPLLTGKDAPKYDNCQHIEWLLLNLREAIRRRGKP